MTADPQTNASVWAEFLDPLHPLVAPQLGLQLLVGAPLLSLRGMRGSNFNVQHAATLDSTNWRSLRSISNLSVSPFQFTDPSGSSEPARFYRAIMW